MLPKALVSILVSLHLLSPSAASSLTGGDYQQAQTVTQGNVNDKVTLPEEVYADIALQHELDHLSVYYFDDNPKDTVSIKADKNWVPASTVKVFAAMYAFDQAARGKISLDQSVTIDAKNVAASQSDPSGYPPLEEGDTVSVYRLVDQMITQSDNTAFNTLLDLLDRQEIDTYIHDLGLTSSSIGSKLNLSDAQQSYEYSVPGYGDNITTASDYAKAFILIKGGRIPGSSSLFDILSRQKLNSMIPAYLPKDVQIAHKTGELDPYYHDGGIIVDPNRKYVLSVFSDLGDPSVIAHLSYLIYSEDMSLVGNNSKNKAVSEIPNAPIDPLVTEGTLEDVPGVLAASTANIKIPAITATDLGIKASDLSSALNSGQLPPVIIPNDSPYHILVDVGARMRVALNPIPSLRVSEEADNQKLKLAEANYLLAKGKKAQADALLSEVNANISTIAKEAPVKGNTRLQTSIDQVSETRFSILRSELASADDASRVQVIKEVAKQAIDTTDNVKPYVQDAVKTDSLSLTPVVGQVVGSTSNSITVKTVDGKEITTPIDTQIKTRSVDQTDAQIENITSIPVGSTVALAGFDPSNKSDKPSFILTNVASDSANPTPVTVIKVNQDTNTLVVAKGGVPVQVDLTPNTIIKGINTTISINEIKPGDVIVIHGQPIPVSTSSAEVSPSPSSSPTENNGNGNGGSGSAGEQTGSGVNPTAAAALLSPTPVPLSTPISTILPLASANPSVQPGQAGNSGQTKVTQPTSAPSQSSKTKSVTPAAPTKPVPQVIKGNVIQVVQQAPTPVHLKPATPATAPSTPVPTSKPNK